MVLGPSIEFEDSFVAQSTTIFNITLEENNLLIFFIIKGFRVKGVLKESDTNEERRLCSCPVRAKPES